MTSPSEGDLTTSSGWDAIWSRLPGSRTGLLRGHLRARLPWVRAHDAVIAELLDAAAMGQAIDVLELGCAPGSMLLRMHQQRPHHRYQGVDMAEQGLRITSERLRAAGIAAELRQGDARTIDPRGGADLVVSFGLIEHFDDPSEILRAHVRLARRGAHVAVTVPNYAHPVVRGLLERFSAETLDTHNLTIMSERALQTALASVGLVEVVTGAAMGPVLPSSRPRPGLAGLSYRTGARAWNLAAPSIPGLGRLLWDGLLWGRGRRP